MARNGKAGDGNKNGVVRDRSRTNNPKTDQWVKRNTDASLFIGVKQDGTPFKRVIREKGGVDVVIY